MSYSGTDVFANKIVCGECGSQFGKKEWHSNDKYRYKDKSDRVKVLETYIKDLKASKNKHTDFDEGLFCALVNRVKVNKNSIKIIWKDGTES